MRLLPVVDCQHTTCIAISSLKDEIHFQAY